MKLKLKLKLVVLICMLSFDAHANLSCFDIFTFSKKNGSSQPFFKAEIVTSSESLHAQEVLLSNWVGFDIRSPGFTIYSMLGRPERYIETKSSVLIQSPGEPMWTRGADALRAFEQVFQKLYSRYEQQGPERRDLLPRIIEQDQAEQRDGGKTAHFILDDGMRTGYGHVQVLISHGSKEPLHVETQWGSQLGELARKSSDEKIGEVGRLLFFDPKFEIAQVDASYSTGRQTLSYINWHMFKTMLEWVNNESGLDRLLIQVNPQVFRAMELGGFPMDLGKRLMVSSSWNDKAINEWVVSFDKGALLKFEEVLYRQILLYNLKNAYASKDIKYNIVRIGKQELKVLKRLGWVKFSDTAQVLETRVGTFFVGAVSDSGVPMFVLPKNVESVSVVIAASEAKKIVDYLQYKDN